ncbi:MAG: glycosyltransferase family 2 protein [Candidatus Paceibacterota bacterium]|jgi:glycosyltransferase involved in cell wall biosynthesis
MENNILLSIAVTTYNRRRFLETTVSRSIKQIVDAGLENEVEIVISNDTSPDNTAEYVTAVDTQYSFVRGFNQPKNLGVTKNLEWIVNEARGTYVQLFGDDDLLEDGAIVAFVKAIKKYKPNFILVNTNNIHSLDDANKEYKVVLENRLNIQDDIFMEDFTKDYGALEPAYHWWYLTNFITANIFRKDLWQKEMEAAKKYVKPKNVFLWQAPLIIGISKYGKLLLMSECFILCRKNPTDNYVLDPRGRYYINLFESIEISHLVKIFMPSLYKQHKKIYAAFVMDSFILETNNGKNVRKFAWIAFCSYFDIFPENIQFLSMTIAPKLITHFAPKLKNFKKSILY